MSEKTGIVVEKSKLTSRTDEAPLDAGRPSSSASSAWAPESLDQMKSKSFQAAKLGFVAGAVIALKAKQLQLFTITSLTDAEAKVKDEGGNEVNIAMGDFLDQYRLHKGKVTDVLPGWSPGDHSFWCHTSEAWGIDVVKGCIGYALRATYAKHLQSLKLIQLLIKPTSVKLVAPAKAEKSQPKNKQQKQNDKKISNDCHNHYQDQLVRSISIINKNN